VKNIGKICHCRVVLRGLLYLIGTALGIFNFLVLSTNMRADDFSGRVVGISDGDTISVMHGGSRSTPPGIRNWKSWNLRQGQLDGDCGLILIRFQRGNTAWRQEKTNPIRTANQSNVSTSQEYSPRFQ